MLIDNQTPLTLCVYTELTGTGNTGTPPAIQPTGLDEQLLGKETTVIT